jgi:hypothetical protein
MQDPFFGHLDSETAFVQAEINKFLEAYFPEVV